MAGRSKGSVIERKVRSGEAPSTRAARARSSGMDCSPASRSRATNGVVFQTSTRIAACSASAGRASTAAAPLYGALRAIRLLDTLPALILPYASFSLPLALWLLTGTFRALPAELYRAARVDGCTPLGAFRRVLLPLAAPGVATAGLLVFVFAWNEFMLALTFMTRDGAKTVTAGIASVGGTSLYEIPWGPLAAAVVLATAPLVALVFAFQGKIVSGLTRGGVKG